MSHNIEYLDWTFTPDQIISGNLYLATSLLASSLEVNSLSAEVECSDPRILDFERKTPLRYYAQPDRPMIFRLQSIMRVGPNLYELTATSTLGLLIEDQHMGGIYTGQTAKELISDICGTVPFFVKSNLEEIKLYGWLPIASPRDNLSQVLFALGAALKTDLDGVLRIEGLWDGISSTVPKIRMYEGANMDYEGKVTQVIVNEHQYVPWTEEKQLFEGTAQRGDIITFDEPMHSLKASGFTILSSGANWAKVSAGSGVLSGKTYLHNTRQISKDVFPAKDPNVKTVKDATLVSLVNSQACAQRLADYYKFRERVDSSVVYHGETPGDRLSTYHPFDKTGVDACLESADITLSGTLKAQEKSLVGFVPKKIEQVVTYDHVEVLTESGTWTVPDGVSQVRVVCIGGGFGGSSGYMGKPNKPNTGTRNKGSGHETSGGNGVKYRSYWDEISHTEGGEGGGPGEPGQGGKIYSTTIEVTPRQTFSIKIGTGGAGGSGTNSGVDTIVPGSPGGATTFGNITSESGSSSPFGYMEEVTQKTYASTGGNGISGQKGVYGKGEVKYSSFWNDYSYLEMTFTVPEPLVFQGKSYVAGQVQENINAYNTEYGDANSSSGERSYGWARGLGGGAAAGVNGPSSAVNSREGARGAKPIKPPIPTERGRGGNAGHGGGGAGGAGGRGYYIRIRNDYSASTSTPSLANVTSGGEGGDGGDGAPGCVILYYGVQEEIVGGQFVDKNGKSFLDHFSRRLIV